MYAQWDIEGNQYWLIGHIVDHKEGDDAINEETKMSSWRKESYQVDIQLQQILLRDQFCLQGSKFCWGSP